ncbi:MULTISPECIES: caspase family protein [unclassified Gordonia (in: high G+C Gram-positive bacteria)]|uniref:caspase family protein n=1 Tax=unclassified Gordonia (in: high G+C Gram-positive bacteria) TaxID=2657482 RepID=UPI0012E83001|nr:MULTISPECIES: caspase family protein [unclassified Gordonia (in: high G+C Gram-positive bacteria)]
MVDPSRTSVLAVGLEKYKFGQNRSLPGVADHAIRFARWAISQGVPVERVRLSCSWDSEPNALPGVTDVAPNGPALVQAMRDLLTEGGDLLLVYWCGHGVSAHGARALFTADADDELPTNLAVDKIRQLLGSSLGVGFPQQLLFFDACANHFEHLGYKGGLPSTPFPEGLTPRGAKQFFYFATEIGRVALYDRSARQAAFSTQVIGWMESQPGQPFPPNVHALSAQVNAAFEAASGDSPIPVTLVVEGLDGNAIDRTFVGKAAPRSDEDYDPAGSRVAVAEAKAEKRSEWAVDVRGVRERVVNATQRLTLDRTFEVAVVEAAGVTRSRLDEAEKVLDVTAIRWTPRYWFPVDAGAVARLDQRLAAVREQIGGAHLALVVHGGGGRREGCARAPPPGGGNAGCGCRSDRRRRGEVAGRDGPVGGVAARPVLPARCRRRSSGGSTLRPQSAGGRSWWTIPRYLRSRRWPRSRGRVSAARVGWTSWSQRCWSARRRRCAPPGRCSSPAGRRTPPPGRRRRGSSSR